MEASFKYLLRLIKNSLQRSDKELQDTLIDTIYNISRVKIEILQLPVAKVLLYYIMIPTSNFNWIAINIFLELAKLHNLTTPFLYQKYKNELCKEIVELCAINQALVNWNLSQSLEKVSLLLDFFNCKDFVDQNSHYILSYLVPLVVIMPKVASLIEEVSNLIGVELPELLANKYGNIFLRGFLYETDSVFQKSMKYLEKVTGMSGPALRKRSKVF